jgi:GAF domain-containing protein
MSAGETFAQAVADAARRAARADAARIVAVDGQLLRVVAVAGGGVGWRVGQAVATDAEGIGYVIASAQPFSVAEVDTPGGRPSLCVPCILDGEPLGAIELVGRPGADTFSIEATEVATLFADVAAAALAAGDDQTPGVPTARELAAELTRLEDTDPALYASVARAVSAVLA